MARNSSHSRSRSPGPWRARDRGGAGAMAFVGPPPSRLRGNAGLRSSRVSVGDQHEKTDESHRGTLKGKASGEEFYSSRGGRSGGGGGGIETQKHRGGSRSWQPHAGGGGGGTTTQVRHSGEETGAGGGDGNVTSRKSSVIESKADFRRVRNSSSSRRHNHRSDARGVGASADTTYHGGYAHAAGAPPPYDKRSSSSGSTWGHRRGANVRSGGTATDDAYTGGAGHDPAAAAAAVPASYGDARNAGRNLESQPGSWGGTGPQQEGTGNPHYFYYQGGGASNAVDTLQQHQQQGGGFSHNGGPGGATLHCSSGVFDGEAGATAPGRGTQDIGGGGTVGGNAAGGGIPGGPAGVVVGIKGQGEDLEEQLLHRPLLNFKQFVVMKPDDCTQKELSQAYEAYVERHTKYHAEQFFEKHGGDAFMRELYHPNLRRRQHEIQKARAKMLAQAFLQRYQDGVFAGLLLEADSEEVYRFYGSMEEDSPLLLKQWPTTATVSRRGIARFEEDGEAEVVEVEDDGSEGGDATSGKRDDAFDEDEEGKDNSFKDVMQEGEHRRRRNTANARSLRRKSSAGGSTAAASEGETEARGSSHTERRKARSHNNKRWPPFVSLPSPDDCLAIHAVDPSISKLEIFDELAV